MKKLNKKLIKDSPEIIELSEHEVVTDPVFDTIKKFYEIASITNHLQGPNSKYWHPEDRVRSITEILRQRHNIPDIHHHRVKKIIANQKDRIEIEKIVIGFYGDVLDSFGKEGRNSIYFEDRVRLEKLQKKIFAAKNLGASAAVCRSFFRKAEKQYHILKIKQEIIEKGNKIN